MTPQSGGTGPNARAATHRPLSGATPEGNPLSFNRAPARDLEPWVGRVMVALTDAPDDARAWGLLCNDAAYVRAAMMGRWDVQTAEGQHHVHDCSFLTGQHNHFMRLDYSGPIRVAGMMLRPGALRAIWGVPDAQLVQRLQILEPDASPALAPHLVYHPDMGGEEWLTAMEDWLRQLIAQRDAPQPSAVSHDFELHAFADPNRPLSELCEELGVTMRSLQRTVRRDFGLTPKQVMRRARILDIASRLCGVADEEEEEILLRFFDQSHLIREFHAFFGLTPTAFRAQRNALLTLSLEIRQARRLEMLDRLAPGAVRPWMRAPFRPFQPARAGAG